MTFAVPAPRRFRHAFLLVFGLTLVVGHLTYAAGRDAEAALADAARESRTRLEFDGDTFAGPGLGRLLEKARQSQFFLVGEEHGIAENPQLVAELFTTLVADGYEKLVIEVSPPIARILDEAARVGGIEGLRTLYATPGGEPAFFGMREEAQMLARVRGSLPDADEVFWGVDYEVASDRPILRKLRAMRRPASTDAPLEALVAASSAAWSRYEETRNPQFIFSFSGDPALVKAVKDAWPDPDASAARILDTLQQTLEINRHWVEGRNWESNASRAALLRANFLDYWEASGPVGKRPKVLAKLGANHLLRGLNVTGTFDLGTLLPELAAIEGSQSFSLLVLPGRGSSTAVLNPSSWSYEPRPAKDGYAQGIEVLIDAAYPDAFTLIDLAALRPRVRVTTGVFTHELVRIVHGFDMLLVLSGSTASSELQHD